MAGLAVCGGSAVRGRDVLLPDAVYLQRHGDARYVLPHRIDHLANMRFLAEAGCDRVLALGSVGGLHRELVPGTFACPDDFIALNAGPAAFEDERAHRVPGFDSGWRRRVVVAWRDRVGSEIVDGGTYWQTRGPRLETPAEIRLMPGLRGDDPNRHGALLGHVLACRRHCPRGRGRRASRHDRRAADRRRRRRSGETSFARGRSAASMRSARRAS